MGVWVGGRRRRHCRPPPPTALVRFLAVPAPCCCCLQITAEQILRESKALQEAEQKAPVVKITDPEELAEYRLQVRCVGWRGTLVSVAV